MAELVLWLLVATLVGDRLWTLAREMDLQHALDTGGDARPRAARARRHNAHEATVLLAHVA